MPITIASSIAEIISIPLPKDGPTNGTGIGAGADGEDGADDLRPILVVDTGDLPKVAKQLRDIISGSTRFFDRGGPARIAWRAGDCVPIASRLNVHGVVRAAHELCRPYSLEGKAITLPERVAALYLDMSAEWHLSPLVSISTAPILAKDGTIQATSGYQPATGVYCCNIPELSLPLRPTREEAEAALVTRLDRLARSTLDQLSILDAIAKVGAGFRSLADTWADTTTAHGRLILTVLAGLAEFERELIKARTSEGRKRARARGVHLGRPSALNRDQQREALARIAAGEAHSDIARTFGVSHTTISRLAAK